MLKIAFLLLTVIILTAFNFVLLSIAGITIPWSIIPVYYMVIWQIIRLRKAGFSFLNLE